MYDCLLCRVYRQSTVSVQSGDVVITDIMESGSNHRVWLYVQRIAPVQAVISAVEVIQSIHGHVKMYLLNCKFPCNEYM